MRPLDFAVFSHLANKPGTSVEQRLKEFVRELRLIDQLDYTHVFTTEHHFSGDFSLSPSQPITLTLIASNTKRVRFGPMSIILPLSEPLRVAEEMVILDHLSGGRLEVGFGRGTLSHEHKMYGISPQSDRARLAEGLDIVLKLWSSDDPVYAFGEYYKYYGVEMPWKPLQRPHPPIWAPGSAGGSSRTWGKRGFGSGAFGLLPLPMIRDSLAEYREGLFEGGYLPADERSCYMVSTFVGESDAEAKAFAHEHFTHQMKLFQDEAITTRRMNGQSHITNSDSDPYPRLVRETASGANRHSLISGSPKRVIAQIEELYDNLGGFTLFLGEFAFGTMPIESVEKSLKLFSQKVIPHFSRQRTPALAVA